MKRILVSLALIAFAGVSLAATGPGALSWDVPTKNVDGSALAPSQIDGYDIQCTFTPTGGGASSPCSLSVSSFPGSAVSGSVTITYPASGGSGAFQIRTRRTDGFLSDWSPITAQATKALPGVGPNTPGNLKVVSIKLDVSIQLDSGDGFKRSVAYTITKSGPGAFAGFVKIDTPCVGEKAFTYRGQDFYHFLLMHPTRDISNVAWNMPPTDNIAAPCA